MAKQETKRIDKAVRAEMMRLLRKLVENPTEQWPEHAGMDEIQISAGNILKGARLLDISGFITLAGMDYYRRETANPLLTWLRANWFAVIVAGCTIGVSAWGVVGG